LVAAAIACHIKDSWFMERLREDAGGSSFGMIDQGTAGVKEPWPVMRVFRHDREVNPQSPRICPRPARPPGMTCCVCGEAEMFYCQRLPATPASGIVARRVDRLFDGSPGVSSEFQSRFEKSNPPTGQQHAEWLVRRLKCGALT